VQRRRHAFPALSHSAFWQTDYIYARQTVRNVDFYIDADRIDADYRTTDHSGEHAASCSLFLGTTMPGSARGLHTRPPQKGRRGMKSAKWIAQLLVLTAVAGTTAVCAKDDLEEETQEVIDAQQEASEVADEKPQDTAAIRDAGNQVIEEQREAADAMREELKDKGIDTTAPRTTTRE
jgi:hypothetical protein